MAVNFIPIVLSNLTLILSFTYQYIKIKNVSLTVAKLQRQNENSELTPKLISLHHLNLQGKITDTVHI